MYREAVNALKRALQPFRVRIPMSGAKWANEHFYLSPESSGTEGRWSCYPYQVAWLDWMTSDDIEEINFQKSRRVGYTKCLMAATGCLIEQKNRNIAIWQPTDGDAKDFATEEIDNLLRDCEALGNRLKCDVGAKSKHNTIEKKAFHGATLDIRGGKSARNYRRMTKDVAIYDETDGFDRDIEGEGSCFELGDGRLDQAPFPKSIRGSTPRTKGLSLIETAVENSDRVFYRFVKCPECETLQRLEFKQLKWDSGNPDSVRYECLSGCSLHYRQYPEMDKAGRWQTLEGVYYDEESARFFDADDEPIPKPRRIGVRIWAGYSYLRPWSYLVDRWLDAQKNKKSGNITTLKTVINTLLGETFEEEGASVDSSTLEGRGEDYLEGGRIPNEVLVITAGADVQDDANPRLEVEIVGHGLEGETWSLGYHVIPGDPTRQEPWDHLEELLLEKYTRQDGVTLRISRAFIDSGYLTTRVYQFTGPRRKRGVFATKGAITGTLCSRGSWQGEKKSNSRAILHRTNVNDAKEIVFGRLKIDAPGPGYCHFPSHYQPRYFTMLTNEEKVEKRERGVRVGYEWRKKGRNEPLDCRAYALGALAHLNPNLPRLKLRLEKRAQTIRAAAGESVPVKSEAARTKPPRRKPKQQGFVQAWR